ncbi:MAG: hypothetical protein ACKVU4_00340 [Phycisphaerales bacterium]
MNRSNIASAMVGRVRDNARLLAVVLIAIWAAGETVQARQNVTEVWRSPVTGTWPTGDDRGVAASLSNTSQKLYVTGYVTIGLQRTRFMTMRYNAYHNNPPYPEVIAPHIGPVLWPSTETEDGRFAATAMAIDDTPGNVSVYVAGHRPGAPNEGLDMTLIKYDADLNLVWTTPPVYDGPGIGDDVPTAIHFASSGSPETGIVVVCGRSVGSTGTSDYVTLVYNASTGALLPGWPRRLEGPGGDIPVGVHAVQFFNAQGGGAQITVTGTSWNSSTANDFVTLRYRLDGTFDPQWADVGQGVGVRRYNNAPVNGNDVAARMLHTGDQVLITGWSHRGYGGGGGFGPGGGASAMSAPENPDYATVCYYHVDGSLAWTGHPNGARLYNGTADAGDFATAMAVDVVANNSVYVTGYSTGVNSGFDYTTVRYNRYTGNDIPNYVTHRYNGPQNLHDEPVDIVASQRAIYVAGRSFHSGTIGNTYDFSTIRFRNDGTNFAPGSEQGFPIAMIGPGNAYDAPARMVSDLSNAWLTGTSAYGTTGQDFFTNRYQFPSPP